MTRLLAVAEGKTFKREIGAILLGFLCLVAWQAAKAERLETLKVIIWPIMLWSGASYGMAWATKQTDLVKK